MKKTVKAWAKIANREMYEYKKGELIDVGTFRRVLMMNKKRLYEKVIPCTITYEITSK